jgi:hypothetical protein
MGDMKSAYKVLVAKPKVKDAMEHQSTERNAILKRTGCNDVDSIRLRIAISGGLL